MFTLYFWNRPSGAWIEAASAAGRHMVDFISKWDRANCADCGEWLSLGPANDADERVQVEQRAVEIALLPRKWMLAPPYEPYRYPPNIDGAELAGMIIWNGAVIVNVTPEITKDPDRLGMKLMPYGTDELQWQTIDAALSENAVHVVAAWGKWPRALSSWHDRLAKICAIAADVGRDLMCLGTNKDGSPRHPSRLAYDTPIVPWRRVA
ncbi:MAG: DUF1643 domain-containing protein [Hyphomicrobiaceae bacterium]